MPQGLVLGWAVVFAIPLAVAVIVVPFLLRRTKQSWHSGERTEPGDGEERGHVQSGRGSDLL